MKTKTKQRKLRLWGRTQPRLPKPNKKAQQKGSFALRVLGEADGRFSVVKEMRRRLKELMADANVNSMQKRMIAGRAVFLLAYLESLEVDAMEGKTVDMGGYTSTLNSLTGVLNKLGLEKRMKKGLQTLEEYIGTDGERKRKRKH